MTAIQDTFVTIDYTFTDEEGTLLGSSAGSGYYTFQVGHGETITGLERNVAGRAVGESVEFVVQPEEGYGARDATLVFEVPRAELQLGRDPEVGMRISWQGNLCLISAVGETTVTADANHPLAGVPLHFSVRVMGVDSEDPTPAHSCGCGGSCNC